MNIKIKRLSTGSTLSLSAEVAIQNMHDVGSEALYSAINNFKRGEGPTVFVSQDETFKIIGVEDSNNEQQTEENTQNKIYAKEIKKLDNIIKKQEEIAAIVHELQLQKNALKAAIKKAEDDDMAKHNIIYKFYNSKTDTYFVDTRSNFINTHKISTTSVDNLLTKPGFTVKGWKLVEQVNVTVDDLYQTMLHQQKQIDKLEEQLLVVNNTPSTPLHNTLKSSEELVKTVSNKLKDTRAVRFIKAVKKAYRGK